MLMKKFTLVLSLILFCLPTFAQDWQIFTDNFFDELNFAKEYHNEEIFTSKTIIPTEYRGIKMDAPDLGHQLMEKGFVFDVDTKSYFLKNSEPIHFISYWQSIEIEDGIMSFQSVFKSDAVDIGRSIIWFSISEQLGPEGEEPKILSKKGCSFTWLDQQGNGLLLIFFDNAASLCVIPSNKTKTTASSRVNNSLEYVDLGLSVKWAKCNVGASRPEEYGDYFAWGETNKKTTYYWNYKYSKGNVRTLTKYCNNSNYGHSGFSDYKTILELSDDAAQVNCGGSWRMPTATEWNELINNCIWIWKCKNGIYGFEVRSKCNNNFIFLPAAGDKYRDDLFLDNESGFYWSSSLNTDDPDHAKGVRLCSDGVSHCNHRRYTGLSIRPVCQ